MSTSCRPSPPTDPLVLEVLADAVQHPPAPNEPVAFYAVTLHEDHPDVAVGVAATPDDPTSATLVEFDITRLEVRAAVVDAAVFSAGLRLAIASPYLDGPDRRGAVRSFREPGGRLRLDWHATRESVSIVLDDRTERQLDATVNGVARERSGVLVATPDGLGIWFVRYGDRSFDMACLVRGREHITSVPRYVVAAALDGDEVSYAYQRGQLTRPRRDYELVLRMSPPDSPSVRQVGDGWVASFADPPLTTWGATRDAALLALEEHLATLLIDLLREDRPLPGDLARRAIVRLEVDR